MSSETMSVHIYLILKYKYDNYINSCKEIIYIVAIFVVGETYVRGNTSLPCIKSVYGCDHGYKDQNTLFC